MRTLILLFLSHPVLMSYAQIQLPFPDSNATWTQTAAWHTPPDPPGRTAYRYFVNGDTTFVNQDTLFPTTQYKKLSVYYLGDPNTIMTAGYYRTDSNKVYFHENPDPNYNGPGRQYASEQFETANEILLYDFGLEVGDTFMINSTNPIVVSFIDSAILNGNSYKRISFNTLNWWVSDYYWIEGIGSSIGFFPYYYFFEYGVYLNCFNENGEDFIFDLNGGSSCDDVSQNELALIPVNIFPNPATLEINVKGYNPGYLKLCDMPGQIVAEASNSNKLYLGNLAEGLYVLQLFDKKGNIVKAEKIIVNK